MRSSLKIGLPLAIGLVAATVHTGWVQVEDATYVKGALCIACHKALNKDIVAAYETTKHGQVKPVAPEGETFQPVDIYRRSVGFVPADNSFFEPGVGCQSCHGPGSKHVGAKTEDKPTTIVRADKLDTPAKKLSVCGRCHGRYTVDGQPFAANFKPGMDLFQMPGFQLTEVTGPGPFQQLNDLHGSKHGANDLTCLTCHLPHGEAAAAPQLRKAVPELCLDCHTETHPCTVAQDKVPAGATCVTCHMPDGRHTFAVVK